MYYTINLKTGTTTYPVSLAEVKNYIDLNSEITVDDGLIDDLIESSTSLAERYTRRSFITKTYELSYDKFPLGQIKIPLGVLQSIEKVLVIAEDETSATQSSDLYSVKLGERGSFWLKSSNSWSLTDRSFDFFRVEFKAGYGATEDDIPKAIKQGILAIIAYQYEHRETGSFPIDAKSEDGNFETIPIKIINSLYSYRIITP